MIVIHVIALVVTLMQTVRKNKDINTVDYLNYDFSAIDDILNKYIDDAGTNYKIENLGFIDPDQLYLTEDNMNDMIKYMVKQVLKRFSPEFISVLKLSYVIEDDKDVVSFLYEKIKIYVLEYSLETNKDVE